MRIEADVQLRSFALPGPRTGTEQRVDAEGNQVTSVRRPFSLRP